MRSLAKYTSYPKNIPNVIPFKLLKFKSSKWKKIKKIIKNKIKIFKKRKQSSFFLKKRNRLLLLKKTRFFKNPFLLETHDQFFHVFSKKRVFKCKMNVPERGVCT